MDKYIKKDGTMSTREMEIPKLSPAYLQSFGLETPLSKRQNDLLRHRALSPETIGINPQVQSLFGKALIKVAAVIHPAEPPPTIIISFIKKYYLETQLSDSVIHLTKSLSPKV